MATLGGLQIRVRQMIVGWGGGGVEGWTGEEDTRGRCTGMVMNGLGTRFQFPMECNGRQNLCPVYTHLWVSTHIL